MSVPRAGSRSQRVFTFLSPSLPRASSVGMGRRGNFEKGNSYTLKLWARNGEAVRQAIELGEIAHIETASEELTDEFLLWLLLDSRVVDVLRLSNLMLVTLSSLQPFSDNVGAEDPRIP